MVALNESENIKKKRKKENCKKCVKKGRDNKVKVNNAENNSTRQMTEVKQW